MTETDPAPGEAADSWGNCQFRSPVIGALTQRLATLSVHSESSGLLLKSDARAPPQAG